MTFCLGMRVKDGLVGIADTRVTSGTECITAKKVSVYSCDGFSLFLMSSGLRSVRDKALTYFDEIMQETQHLTHGRLFNTANLFAEQIRRVAAEDRKSLEESGFKFDIHVLMGGQLEKDQEHKLYLIYPQGNWVEISRGTPYHIIGASGYGKPVLDRTLKYEDSLGMAIKAGCLAFDSTRISAADVDFPVDIVLYLRDTFQIYEHRFAKQDLAQMSTWWQERLRTSVHELPIDWAQPLLDKIPDPSTLPLPMRSSRTKEA